MSASTGFRTVPPPAHKQGAASKIIPAVKVEHSKTVLISERARLNVTTSCLNALSLVSPTVNIIESCYRHSNSMLLYGLLLLKILEPCSE
jgi:hypothetical protein